MTPRLLPLALTLPLSVLLAGCSGGTGGHSAMDSWTGPSLAVGDVWRQFGQLEDRANYSIDALVGTWLSPVRFGQNETWHFVVRDDSGAGVEFSVSREGPIPKTAAWGFSPVAVPDACRSVPELRNDPLRMARQLEAAGWRAERLGTELRQRPPPYDWVHEPIESGGRPVQMECDWRLSVLGHRIQDDGALDGMFPALPGSGWQSGDGFIFGLRETPPG